MTFAWRALAGLIARRPTADGGAFLRKVTSVSPAQRRHLGDRDDPDLSISVQASLLGVSRASLYYQPVGPSAREVAIKHRLDELAIDVVLAAVDAALMGATPQICNSDQGSHFTRPLYTHRLRSAGVQISMDGRGRARDNIFTERFWRSLKYEDIYLHDYDSPRPARQGIDRYIE